MGLLTIIKKLNQKSKQCRILVLGLDNSGKTTIVKWLLGEDVRQVEPTLGFNIKTIIYQGYSLNCWDIGGQKGLRPYWRNYFEETDAVIWVVDSADRDRLVDCKEELKGLLQEERLAGASLLVFANKQDIPGCLTPEQISDALELESLKSHTCHIQPCSAYGGDGDRRIWLGLDWVVEEIKGRKYFAAAVEGPVRTRPDDEDDDEEERK